jgi:glycosyltransferase involved in cell wall biosynthesis
MACETPVIGASSGSIPDIIADAGLVFPEGDIRALTTCIERLMEDVGLRKDLGNKGRERTIKNYSWKTVAKQYVSMYEELLRNQMINSSHEDIQKV